MSRYRLWWISLVLILRIAWLPWQYDPTIALAEAPTPAQTWHAYIPLVGRGCISQELLRDGGFEAGLPNPAWQTSSNVASSILDNTPDPASHSGIWKAWLGGDNLVQESLWQTVSVPAGTTSLQVSYWWLVSTAESAHPFDTLDVQLRTSDGTPWQTLETLTDGNAGSVWRHSTFTVTSPYAGQPLQLAFVVQTDDTRPTSFFLDDVSLITLCPVWMSAVRFSERNDPLVSDSAP